MLKSLRYMVTSVFVVLSAMVAPIALVGCETTPTATAKDPKQVVIDSTYASYKGLDLAAQGTLAALKAGKLSTADARKALDGYKQARAALDAVMLTLGAPPPVAPPQ